MGRPGDCWPTGYTFTNILLTWNSVTYHKPCKVGFAMDLSPTGPFQSEEVTASTPDETGSSSLVLEMRGKPEFTHIPQVYVWLRDWFHAVGAVSKSSELGLVMTADIVDPKSVRVIGPQSPDHVLHGKYFAVDQGSKLLCTLLRILRSMAIRTLIAISVV